jgi:hypothetical protein
MREHLTFAAQLEIGVLREERGGRRQEAEGRSQKKCFYKYEIPEDENEKPGFLGRSVRKSC